MCGICGFTGFEDKGLLRRMYTVAAHRGPDDSGFFVDKNVNLGNSRLSIIDVKGGHQPVHNEDENIWITYNGEIYNFLELKENLERIGHQFYTNSDTEVMVHAYEEFGIRFITRLRGMFAFAIWDSDKRKLILGRDRLGIKPLYYTFQNGRLIFGSEIKSILQHDSLKREVNFEALHHFLTLQYVPGPMTMFLGINKLQPGYVLSYQDGKASFWKYWDLNAFPSARINEDYYIHHLLNLMKESIRLRLIGEVPLGIFLSGGLDSSSITALASEMVEEPLKTFTIGFGLPTDEFKYARVVADHLGTDHREITIRDFAKSLPEIVWHFDEPLADPAAIPTYLVSKYARKFVTVVLVGEGGDEIFAGYDRYKYLSMAEKIKRYACSRKSAPSAFTVFLNLTRRHHARKYLDFLANITYSPKNDLKSYLKLCMAGFNEEEKRALYTLEMGKATQDLYTAEILKPYFEKDIPLVYKLVLFDLKVWLCDKLLMRVDKMTMAFSVEARVPLLDHKLIELASTMPLDLRLNKYLLKKIMSKHLPKKTIRRKKCGFFVPINHLLAGELGEISRQILDRINKTYFKKSYVKNHILKDSGRLMHDHQIWNLLNFTLWHKLFIENDNVYDPELSIEKLF